MADGIFLCPSVRSNDPRTGAELVQAKYADAPGIARFGTFPLAHGGLVLARFEGGADILRAIANDSECFSLCDKAVLDAPIADARTTTLRDELEARGIAAHWLGRGDTYRSLVKRVAAMAILAQRLECDCGQNLPSFMARNGVDLESKWDDAPAAFRDRMIAARVSLRRYHALGRGENLKIREALQAFADSYAMDTLVFNGVALVPDHSYGDRDAFSAEELFSAGIGGNFSNGSGPWPNTCTHSGGEIFSGTSFGKGSMVWTAGTFGADQWAQIDGALHRHIVGVSLRANTTDRAGYIAYSDDGNDGVGTRQWILRTVSSGGTETTIATATAGYHEILTGDTFTGEVEGTTLRAGSNDSGGGDTERIAQSNGDHATGRPGVITYGADASDQTKIAGWRAGDMAVTGVTVDLSANPGSVSSSGVDPGVVAGSLNLDMSGRPGTVVSSAVNPTVQDSGGSVVVDLSSLFGSVVASGIDPTTLLSGIVVDLAGEFGSVASSAVNPTVIMPGMTVVPAPGVSQASGVDPSVIAGGITLDLSLSPGSVASSGVNPAVSDSSVSQLIDLSTVPGIVVSSGVDPGIVLSNVTVDLSPYPGAVVSTAVMTLIHGGLPQNSEGQLLRVPVFVPAEESVKPALVRPWQRKGRRRRHRPGLLH